MESTEQENKQPEVEASEVEEKKEMDQVDEGPK